MLAKARGTWDTLCKYEEQDQALHALEMHHLFQHLYFCFL